MVVNNKRVWHIYQAQSLQLSKRRKKKWLPERVKRPSEVLAQPNVCWSLDFMSHALTDVWRFCTLHVEDWNRERLGIEADFSLPATRVVILLITLVSRYRVPARIRVDNGPELISKVLQTGARASTSSCTGFSPPIRYKILALSTLMAIFAVSCSVTTSSPAYAKCVNSVSTSSTIIITCGRMRLLTS